MKMLWITVPALLALVSACGEPGTGRAEAGFDANGTWLLRGYPLEVSSGGNAPSFPFAPQAVTIAVDDGSLLLDSPDLGEREYRARGKVYARRESHAEGACAVDLDSSWLLHSVLESRLAATFSLSVAVVGPCGEGIGASGTTRFAVSGERQ